MSRSERSEVRSLTADGVGRRISGTAEWSEDYSLTVEPVDGQVVVRIVRPYDDAIRPIRREMALTPDEAEHVAGLLIAEASRLRGAANG